MCHFFILMYSESTRLTLQSSEHDKSREKEREREKGTRDPNSTSPSRFNEFNGDIRETPG